MKKIDRLDVKLLNALQADASHPLSELSDLVGLSPNACWKRVKRLEEDGIIERRVALLNRQELGLAVTAFVAVRTNQHDEKWLKQFATGVRGIPEVTEFYRMAGEIDYMLKVVCSDIADYDRIYKKLIKVVPLNDVSASFAIEQIKFTTEAPIREWND